MTVVKRYPRAFIAGMNVRSASTVCARSPPASWKRITAEVSPAGVALVTIRDTPGFRQSSLSMSLTTTR